MIYKSEPSNFEKKFEVVSCFCEADGKFLILHKHESKKAGNKWGPPAGKVKYGESLFEAIKRKVVEETGIELAPDNTSYHTRFYVDHQDANFVFHVFRSELENIVESIALKPTEHKAYNWVSPAEALEYQLIDDQEFVIRDLYNNMLAAETE